MEDYRIELIIVSSHWELKLIHSYFASYIFQYMQTGTIILTWTWYRPSHAISSLRIDKLELSSASKVIWYKSLQLGATQPVVFITVAEKRTYRVDWSIKNLLNKPIQSNVYSGIPGLIGHDDKQRKKGEEWSSQELKQTFQKVIKKSDYDLWNICLIRVITMDMSKVLIKQTQEFNTYLVCQIFVR